MATAEEARVGSEAVSDITTLPILILNLHGRCNCRCTMCDIWKRTESHELSLQTLHGLRDDLQRLKVKWVVLTGGEPLMHSDFPSVCTFLKSLGIRITLLTSGLLLERHCKSVCDHVDDCIISLDGPSAIHDQIRGVPGACDRIQRATNVIRGLRPDFTMSARTTVQKSNFDHLRDTVATAQSLGLASISFLAADVTSTAFNRNLVWPVQRQNEIALDSRQVSTLETEIESLIVERALEIDSGYIRESPDKLRRIARHFRALIEGALPPAPICNAPWISAVLETDGVVRPCFFHEQIGDINQHSLQEVLNKPAAVDFRKALDVTHNPICRRCVCSLNYKD
ncbi:MAG TPA: radical SAM protein [Terriglobales bacterium]|nr:radical SAM protein [Terriglobales bacterium]